MPSEIKLWQIEENTPKSVDHSTLDLESRLERWIRQDIGLVNDDLLVIGQQVKTAGGIMDLLAVDSDANLVILELKKGQTPREVVAQALDYASWVQDLTLEAVENIASDFLGPDKSFDQAFTEKFGDGLPEIINGQQRMYIVASSLDSATERIIKYLSETHGVDLNAATFAYFKTDSMEWLGRSMLLDEETVRTRAENRTPSKRITLEELRDIAKENSVVGLWDKAFDEFDSVSQGKPRSRGRSRDSKLHFMARLNGRRGWFLRMYPGESSSEKGLSIEINRDRITRNFNLTDDQISDACGDADKSFFDVGRLDKLIKLLKQSTPQS